MNNISKTLLALLSAGIMSAAVAAPTTVSTSYRNDEVLDVEGVEVRAEHEITKHYTVSVNAFANEDKLISYGATIGTPLKLRYTTVLPYIGTEVYRPYRIVLDDAIMVNAGFRTNTPITRTFGLTTDIKWTHGTGSSNDLEDVSYAVGLFKKFG